MQWYYQFYPIFRQHCPDQWFIIAPQIFYEIPGTFWQQFMANSSYTKVLQDIHECALLCPAKDTTPAPLCCECCFVYMRAWTHITASLPQSKLFNRRP
jgi:hypothetical protein